MGENLVQKKPIRGVRIRTFNACMIALSSVLFIFIIYNISVMPKLYHTLAEHTDEYIACEKDANVTRRRENALVNLEKQDAGEAAQESLQAALDSSNDLMVREIYSMKLVSVANGYSDDVLPQEVCSL